MTKIAQHQFQKHQSTFCLPKEGQDEPNPAPATQCNSNQSPAAATQRAADGHLMLLLLDVLLIIHQNLILLPKLLYPKTPRNRIKSRRTKTKRKRKRSMLHPTRTTQGRKRAVSRLTKTEKRTKKPVRPIDEIGMIKKSL